MARPCEAVGCWSRICGRVDSGQLKIGDNPSTWSEPYAVSRGCLGGLRRWGLGAAAGNLLVARDPLATAAAADHAYSCGRERILSIIPAWAAARYEPCPRLWTSAPPRPKAVIGPDRPLRRSFP